MYKLFMKELRLSSHPLSYVFIIFSFAFLVPGYPVLCAPFFVSLGIFQSFQKARENGDILFSVLLPLSKKDTVKGKFIFVLFIELCSALVMALCVVLRGTKLRYNPIYLTNPMMRSDLIALSCAFFIFALFNLIFVGGFFHTAYNIGRPFLFYALCAFTVVGIGEAASHLSFMKMFDNIWAARQFVALIIGILLYFIITFLSYRMSVRRFENLDL